MIKIILNIKGMACPMCEAHINDTVRRQFTVDKVTSSHKEGQTVILTKQDIDDGALTRAVAETGYELQGIAREPYEKKGFFARFKKG